ncbi:hypothetical protein LCGC14_0159620 [marine sediment metagenome]|uniref:Uncharacterized protein n=1 Tax=marine sediment metagenome TaxID=412755 RepID=A0A0F9XY19_9ZZZZ|nr:hypothetical protein [Halomonas sp.]HDZ46651.1 hypothetical protein [Halomonas sp.]HEB06411.1 hypothetical protein [Halomonas sp.]
MSEVTPSHYGSAAYQAGDIPLMPAPQRKRERVGEELLPFGDYAGIDPYQQLCEDSEFVQHQDSLDKAFYKTNDWWWDHQRIRFLESKMGVTALLLLLPYVCAVALLAFVVYIGIELTFFLDPVIGGWAILAGMIFFVLGVTFIFVVMPYVSRFTMSGAIWLVTPLHKYFSHQGQRYMESRQSELNRQTGLASFAQGKKTPPLVAPFIEFDGYVERVVQRGGIFYRLMFVHRYTGKQFSQTSLSTIVDHKHEVHALWDMLQRYMDVSQPMPDVPRLEPFRHLDPTTAEHDQKTGREPRYWRDLDLEEWKKGDGAAHLKAQMEYPWSRQRCQLTPQLGKVEMATYRERQQAAEA